MEKITTVGLDLAKQVMAVHAVDGRGMLVMRKVLRREALLAWSAALSPCVIAMEACGGAHHWARELTRQGHTVRIIAAEFVKPFRKSGKNDANDAEAICTAVRQPNMRFVAIKSVEQTGGAVRAPAAPGAGPRGAHGVDQSAARVAHRVRDRGTAVAGEVAARIAELSGRAEDILTVGGTAARAG